MAASAPMPRGVDPKLTESYLINLVGVVDASVYWCDGMLNAFVTVLDDCPMTPRDYQNCCVEDLGLHQTPKNIQVALRRLRAA